MCKNIISAKYLNKNCPHFTYCCFL